MANIEFDEGLADDIAEIRSPKLREELFDVLETLELFGDVGSRNVPSSIVSKYGDGIRKFAVGPFILVYSYDAACDMVSVKGLIHQKRAL